MEESGTKNEPRMDPYADIRPNESLCTEFTRYMESKGMEYYCDFQKKDIGAFSTDMGTHTTPPLPHYPSRLLFSLLTRNNHNYR